MVMDSASTKKAVAALQKGLAEATSWELEELFDEVTANNDELEDLPTFEEWIRAEFRHAIWAAATAVDGSLPWRSESFLSLAEALDLTPEEAKDAKAVESIPALLRLSSLADRKLARHVRRAFGAIPDLFDAPVRNSVARHMPPLDWPILPKNFEKYFEKIEDAAYEHSVRADLEHDALKLFELVRTALGRRGAQHLEDLFLGILEKGNPVWTFVPRGGLGDRVDSNSPSSEGDFRLPRWARSQTGDSAGDAARACDLLFASIIDATGSSNYLKDSVKWELTRFLGTPVYDDYQRLRRRLMAALDRWGWFSLTISNDDVGTVSLKFGKLFRRDLELVMLEALSTGVVGPLGIELALEFLSAFDKEKYEEISSARLPALLTEYDESDSVRSAWPFLCSETARQVVSRDYQAELLSAFRATTELISAVDGLTPVGNDWWAVASPHLEEPGREWVPVAPTATPRDFAGSWVDQLLCSEDYSARRRSLERFGVSDDDIRSYFLVLGSASGRRSVDSVCARLSLPRTRVVGLTEAIRRVVNIEGSSVLAFDSTGDYLELDVELLKRQFRLPDRS